ncbi:MAG TPA: hypothetical protein VKG44_05565, partial [Candidatus Baltobacteraceae bacterium]|nr:hypothetical protein [Candidatus Baltobacteraceae bacterium]
MSRSFDIRAWFAGRRSPGTPYEQAVAALERGAFREALERSDGALREATDDSARADAHNKRGVALIGLARREDALAAFGDALTCVENHAPALVNVGNLLLEEGHLE